jgi:hypothetical protein
MSVTRCPVCRERYLKPGRQLQFCSHPFHCCRDCEWADGRIVKMCDACREVYRCRKP